MKNADATPVRPRAAHPADHDIPLGKVRARELEARPHGRHAGRRDGRGAPLLVLHAIARVDAPCATHVTLTLRDHAMDVQLSDLLLPQGRISSHISEDAERIYRSGGSFFERGRARHLQQGDRPPTLEMD